MVEPVPMPVQLYVFAPVAVKVAVLPLQIKVGLIVTPREGVGSTCIETVAVLAQAEVTV
jgi:hypothetical protein